MRGMAARIVVVGVVAMSWIATTPRRPAAAAETVTPTLIQTIDTSQLSPPIPDPSGLAFLPSGNLLVADAEVDEIPSLYKGKNVFEVTTAGELVDSFRTTRFSTEPAGLAVIDGRVGVSDDDGDRVFLVGPGPDRRYGTKDDRVRSFSTSPFGSNDPEGLAYGGGAFFIADGKGAEVYRVTRGPNAVFDGVPPIGDDTVSHFDTAELGQPDPEGIEFNADTGTLFIVSNAKDSNIIETTIQGRLLTTIDLSAIGVHSPAGLAFGPGSADPRISSLYIADRGRDNSTDPSENDGRIFEISF